MQLTINKKLQYNATIYIDDVPIVNLSQSFNEEGHIINGIGMYVLDKDKYYANLKEAREKIDEFENEMRKIEDQSVQEVTVNETKK